MTHAATLDELKSVFAKNHSASMLAAQHQLSLAESIAAFFYRCESCSVIEMQAAKPNNGIGVKRRDGQGHSDPKTQKNSPNKAKAAAAHPKAEVSDLSDAALKQIKIAEDKELSLMQNYTCFFENFSYKVAEAEDANRSIKPNVVQSTFKSAISGHEILKLWLEEVPRRGINKANARLLRRFG